MTWRRTRGAPFEVEQRVPRPPPAGAVLWLGFWGPLAADAELPPQAGEEERRHGHPNDDVAEAEAPPLRNKGPRVRQSGGSGGGDGAEGGAREGPECSKTAQSAEALVVVKR